MAEPFLGQIGTFGFNFPPRGWTYCYGQLLTIAQNQALFALLSDFYGGDARSTFGVPDLRGRIPMGQGDGPGLTNRYIGHLHGHEQMFLSPLQCPLPAHTHPATMTMGSLSAQTDIEVSSHTTSGQELLPSNGSTLTNSPPSGTAAAIFLPSGTGPNAPVTLGGVTTVVAGTGTVTVYPNGDVAPSMPVSVVNPVQVINFSIALAGVFPSRN